MDRPCSDDVYVFEDFLYNRSNMIYKDIPIRHLYENKCQLGSDPENMIQL